MCNLFIPKFCYDLDLICDHFRPKFAQSKTRILVRSTLRIFNETNDFISNSEWWIPDWGPMMVAILMLNTSQ